MLHIIEPIASGLYVLLPAPGISTDHVSTRDIKSLTTVSLTSVVVGVELL